MNITMQWGPIGLEIKAGLGLLNSHMPDVYQCRKYGNINK